MTRGKRSWGCRLLWDARRRCWRKTGVIAVPVRDPVYGQLLTLVVARPGQGREPWYLLTNESVRTEEEAWRIVLIYARRWQVEMALRFNKCELAFESPRLHFWDVRLKLLLMARSSMPFCSPFCTPAFNASFFISSAPGAIEPESGTEKPRCRFTVYALLSAAFC